MQTFAYRQAAPSTSKNNGMFSGRVSSAVHTPFIQPKLSVNDPGDQYEKEADTIADKVVSMEQPAIQTKPLPVTAVQRKCAACEEKDKKAQRKETNSAPVNDNSTSLDSYVSNISGKGQALSNGVRSFYEPRFGQDFSNVRIHTDTVAAKSAQSINALAYTTGNNIVFNSGQYAPDSTGGKKLLAHELTHVVQQQGNVQPKSIQRWSWRDFGIGAGVGAGIGGIAGGIIGGVAGGPAGAAAGVAIGGLIGSGIGGVIGGLAGGGGSGSGAASAASTRTVTINISVVQGATDNSARDIQTSNAIFTRNNCNVRVAAGTNVPITGAQATSVLGPDNKLEEPSGDTSSAEEQILTAINRGAGRLTAYYVPAFNPSKRGTSLQQAAHGVPDSLVMCDVAASDTFTHELCHILTRNRQHQTDPDNLMTDGGTRNIGVDNLTPAQCTAINTATNYPQ
ncbi:MAG: DUF4157 domain-containing protein [Chitinophagaceae bacterium]